MKSQQLPLHILNDNHSKNGNNSDDTNNGNNNNANDYLENN